MSEYIKTLKKNNDEKNAILKQELVGNNPAFNMQSFGEHGLTLPYNPSCKLYGIVPE